MSLATRRAVFRFSRLADDVTELVCARLPAAHPSDIRPNVEVVLDALAEVCAGSSVYVPRIDALHRRADIIAAIADGATRRDVCRDYGISRRTFYRYRAMARRAG